MTPFQILSLVLSTRSQASRLPLLCRSPHLEESSVCELDGYETKIEVPVRDCEISANLGVNARGFDSMLHMGHLCDLFSSRRVFLVQEARCI